MLTDSDFDRIKAIVRAENVTLAEALADILAHFLTPLMKSTAEMERSLGMLIDGQALIEKHLAYSADKPDEPWRASLRDDA